MARKSTDARQIITLQCTDCRERNYSTIKKPAQPHHADGAAEVL